jgi:hypothetical protein
VSAKLRVLMAWMPAVCSRLYGVTVVGQPAFAASAGELNQNPMWKVRIGANGGLLAASMPSAGWARLHCRELRRRSPR